jgi:hypothetical protein
MRLLGELPSGGEGGAGATCPEALGVGARRRNLRAECVSGPGCPALLQTGAAEGGHGLSALADDSRRSLGAPEHALRTWEECWAY